MIKIVIFEQQAPDEKGYVRDEQIFLQLLDPSKVSVADIAQFINRPETTPPAK